MVSYSPFAWGSALHHLSPGSGRKIITHSARSCGKINHLTQRRQGAKTRKEQLLCFLCAFYDFAPLREMLLLIQELFHRGACVAGGHNRARFRRGGSRTAPVNPKRFREGASRSAPTTNCELSAVSPTPPVRASTLRAGRHSDI